LEPGKSTVLRQPITAKKSQNAIISLVNFITSEATLLFLYHQLNDVRTFNLYLPSEITDMGLGQKLKLLNITTK
jgi:hypothetical protein